MRQTTIFAFDPFFLKPQEEQQDCHLSVPSSNTLPAKLHCLLRLNLPASDKHMTERWTDGQIDIYLYVETGRQALDSNIRANFHRS